MVRVPGFRILSFCPIFLVSCVSQFEFRVSSFKYSSSSCGGDLHIVSRVVSSLLESNYRMNRFSFPSLQHGRHARTSSNRVIDEQLPSPYHQSAQGFIPLAVQIPKKLGGKVQVRLEDVSLEQKGAAEVGSSAPACAMDTAV